MNVPVREKIGDEVYFNTIHDSRFKTMKISVSAYLPLTEETAAENALLCDILTRSCKSYPTLSLLERKLQSLYGASLSSYVGKDGDSQSLYFSISGIDEKYAFDGTKISFELAKILCSLLFEPNVKDGAFTDEDFRQSLNQLLDAMDADFNEKRTYALMRCTEIMNQGSPAGIRRYGTAENAKKTTPKDLYSAWQRMLRNAKFEIIYIGDTDSAQAKDIFTEEFSKIYRTPAELSTLHFKSKGEVRTVTEEMELSQAKLVMGFESSVTGEDPDYPSMSLLTAILGGTPSSKLFMNVREKQSLCYYCLARHHRKKGYVMIESGVETDNLEKAKNAILEQVDQLYKGNISDSEIESAKLALINGFKSVTDSLYGIETWFMARLETMETPQQAAEKISAVTKEQLVNAAQKIKLDAVYMLKSREEC